MITPTKAEWEILLAHHKDEEYNYANHVDYDSAKGHQERAKEIADYLNSPGDSITEISPEISVMVLDIGLCKATLVKTSKNLDSLAVGSSVFTNCTEIK